MFIFVLFNWLRLIWDLVISNNILREYLLQQSNYIEDVISS